MENLNKKDLEKVQGGNVPIKITGLFTDYDPKSFDINKMYQDDTGNIFQYNKNCNLWSCDFCIPEMEDQCVISI